MRGFLGKEGFVWWHGVVEDTADPLLLGRCRVRVFGFHSADKTELPTESLPWAYPMQPLTSAALSGIGTSPTGLLVGSHVFGFFRDGEEAQDPVMIGSFGGIPMTAADTNKGFNDPSGKYPATDAGVEEKKFPMGVSVVGEQDTNRLARNNDENQMRGANAAYRASTTDRAVQSTPNMAGKSRWSEPFTPYAAVYPKNHVRYTESGHIEEYDDTPGKERIHQYHNSGTFCEVANGWERAVDGSIINPDGTRVQRIVGNDYEIIHGNKKVHIKGGQGLNLVIDGAVNITINGGGNIEINGNTNVLANNDVNLQIEGTLKASGKTIEFYADEDIGFSGKTISFITDNSLMVMQQGKRIEVNSGEPVLNPKRVNVKGGGG
jgi:hypothetical protein